MRKLLTALLASLIMPLATVAPARADLFSTYITGDDGAGPVIFRSVFDPKVAGSASLTVIVRETDSTVRLDNIDFTPGTNFSEVHASVQRPGGGGITQYNVIAGTELPDIVPDTNSVASPPVSGTSRPATVLPTSTHIYYVENQFGFDGPTHRIMRTPITGGVEEVVFDAGAEGIVNLSGLEIVADRLYFFSEDPDDTDARALLSIGLAGGVWDTIAADKEIGGLTEGPGAGVGPFASDGSDELDFDPSTGLIFGTNIVNGEVIAFDPFLGVEVSSPARTHFIDGSDVSGGAPDGLGLLLRQIDGIRPTRKGDLVVVGHAGLLAAISIDGVLAGVDDSDVIALFDDLSIEFDDHTLLAPVPEPTSVAIWSVLGMVGVGYGWRRRRKEVSASLQE